MSFGPLLLRVLLCLAIAFNGVSAAHATPHLEHGARSDATAALTSGHSESGDAMACHAEQGGGDRADAPLAQEPGGDEPDAPPCCKGVCQCACMQHATPANAIGAIPVVLDHEAAQPRRVAAHAPPAVLRLNRPPIG